MNLPHKIHIFSVYQRDEKESTNEALHNSVMRQLKGDKVPIREVIGVYKGNREKSIVISATYTALVKLLCFTHKQASYLTRHSDTSATLTYVDTLKTESLGRFVQVKRPDSDESYTFDPANDTYWVCRKD